MDTINRYNQKAIPHSRPTIGAEEAKAAARVIESGRLAQGEIVGKFEKALSRMVGIRHAAATSSGTAALHLTLLAMSIGPGDEVIIPSYVCTALLNAVNYAGATPVLADIDPKTLNIDLGDVKNRLTARTRAIIVPHLFGLTANLEALTRLNIPIIEDCAQAVGGTYKDKPLGSIGHASILSFYATKMMTTGEGGMVVSNSTGLIDRIKDLREYDNRDDYKKRYNYMMTDLEAAIGLCQLKRLPDFIRKRRSVARKYDRAFEKLDIQLPFNDPDHTYFRYVVNLNTHVDGWIKALFRKHVICARPIYKPIHRYLDLRCYPNSQWAWETSISIPIYPSLADEEIDLVIEAFMQVAEGSICE
jgi:dTDP-4-amino-4,6-dideoxygalactose transaminase